MSPRDPGGRMGVDVRTVQLISGLSLVEEMLIAQQALSLCLQIFVL